MCMFYITTVTSSFIQLFQRLEARVEPWQVAVLFQTPTEKLSPTRYLKSKEHHIYFLRWNLITLYLEWLLKIVQKQNKTIPNNDRESSICPAALCLTLPLVMLTFPSPFSLSKLPQLFTFISRNSPQILWRTQLESSKECWHPACITWTRSSSTLKTSMGNTRSSVSRRWNWL